MILPAGQGNGTETQRNEGCVVGFSDQPVHVLCIGFTSSVVDPG